MPRKASPQFTQSILTKPYLIDLGSIFISFEIASHIVLLASIAEDGLTFGIPPVVLPECCHGRYCTTTPSLCCAGDWAQGFMHAMQALCQLNYVLADLPKVLLSRIMQEQ